MKIIPMKKILIVSCCLLLYGSVVNAQENEKSPIVKYLFKRGYHFPGPERDALPDSMKKWPDTVYYNTPYKATLLGSPTIPISFSRIEYVKGKYQVSPSISIGYGYTWFTGDFIFNENDKITIDPTFFFGLIADVGLQNDFSFNKLTSVFAGGFIGIGSFSLFGGYDFMGNTPIIGLGGRLDIFTVKQSAMKPFGRVYEVRKHKSIAQPIKNE
jgi:hypothetical protein